MRLIDAEELINEIYDYSDEHTYIDDDGDLVMFDVPPWIHAVIYDAPTIEAIPIEWLKQIAEKIPSARIEIETPDNLAVFTSRRFVEVLTELWRKQHE